MPPCRRTQLVCVGGVLEERRKNEEGRGKSAWTKAVSARVVMVVVTEAGRPAGVHTPLSQTLPVFLGQAFPPQEHPRVPNATQ